MCEWGIADARLDEGPLPVLVDERAEGRGFSLEHMPVWMRVVLDGDESSLGRSGLDGQAEESVCVDQWVSETWRTMMQLDGR